MIGYTSNFIGGNLILWALLFFGGVRVFEVAMINDCAYVGETLLKYLPSDVKGLHVKRSRVLE